MQHTPVSVDIAPRLGVGYQDSSGPYRGKARHYSPSVDFLRDDRL